MSGTTSVPKPSLGPTGFVAPSESAIAAGVMLDLQAAFGGGLNPNLETPQGQLASSLAAIIGDGNDQFVSIVNNVDPAYAAGRMQDAIGRIYFLTRNPALPTVVQAVCTGLPGVVIPVGALAATADNTLYTCTNGGTIPLGGSITLGFACTVTGPKVCAAGALTTIFRAIPGWDAITNPTDGVLGADVESRAQFELRRQQSVAQNALGSLSAIQGAVLSVPGVLDAFTTENSTAAPVTLDGVSVPAHGLYVCVAGGLAASVARAIWTKKPPGCAYAGGTTVTVTDSQSGYVLPYPTYAVSFQTAAAQTFIVAINIANSTGVPSNALALVQAAVLAAFAGSDGGPRARIGGAVFASRFYAGIAALGPWAQIISVLLGSAVTSTAAFTATIAGTTMTVSAVASGTLAVGQTIMGGGLPDGVRIGALGTGVGGTGTYTLTLPQTVGGATAFTAIAATLNSITVGVAHVPALSAANIVLTLT